MHFQNFYDCFMIFIYVHTVSKIFIHVHTCFNYNWFSCMLMHFCICLYFFDFQWLVCLSLHFDCCLCLSLHFCLMILKRCGRFVALARKCPQVPAGLCGSARKRPQVPASAARKRTQVPASLPASEMLKVAKLCKSMGKGCVCMTTGCFYWLSLPIKNIDLWKEM